MKVNIRTGLFKGPSNTFLCKNTTVFNVMIGGVAVIIILSLIRQNGPTSTKLPLTYFENKKFFLIGENKNI